MSGTRMRWVILGTLLVGATWSAVAPGQNKPAQKPPPRSTPYWYNRPYGSPFYPTNPNFRPLILHGNNTRVRVQGDPRLDWSFAAPAAAAAAPVKVIAGHISTATTYQLWVPMGYRHNTPHPLVVMVSAKSVPDELVAFDAVCRKYGALFAVAYGGGNDAHPVTRMRLAIDMLDDVRRRMAVDTDRIYIAGVGEGARTACDLAFAYPELVGGVLAIGGASSLRGEPYLRDRARERLSVALITGEQDASRRELTAYRYPVLQATGVRAKLWTVPKGGTEAAALEQAFVWLDAERASRRALGVISPTLRIAEGAVPTPEVWSLGLLTEARARLKNDKTRESGLALLDGVARRWKGTAAALAAERDLAASKDAATVLTKHQLAFYNREAKALDDYLGGTLAARDAVVRATLVNMAIELWGQVEKYGADTKEGKEAAKRLEALRKGLAGK